MQFAALYPAHSRKQSHKYSLIPSIALTTALLCLALPNAYAASHVTLSGNLAAAEVGTSYSAALAASGGTAPYTFTISWGKLPAGLALSSSSGIISGTPSATGNYYFGVHVTDSKNLGGSQNFQITVSSALVVTVTPATATVASSGTIQFTAAVANTSNQAVTWSATLGTISTAGLYQASKVNANSAATVTATSVADSTKSASASVTITAIPLTLAGNFIPAQVGISYSVPLAAGGGTAPYTFAISSGQLPSGLALGNTSGIVSGMPSTTGTFNFGVNVTDSKGVAGSATFQVTVSPAVAITITPSTATVASAGTIAFTDAVSNSSNQSVTWSATTGTVSATGIYQAPTVNANSTATVTATSNADPTKSASASVTITALPLTLTGNFIPAQAGINYSVPLTVGGGTAPYTFAISSGQLPAGLTLGASSGTISGTPSAAGTFSFGVTATDSKNVSGTQTFQLTVSPAVAVTVTPATATVQSSGTVTFTSAVANSSNQTVTWSATSGTISSSGLYQASTTNANSTATVTATSTADPTKSASASVTITAIPLTLSGNFVPAQVGFTYSVPLTVGNGTAPYTFSISSGQLPAGLALGTSSGTISGTPTATGTFSFGVSVTDSKSVAGSATFQITASPAVAVSVTPATATVTSAGTTLFTSTVTNSSNLTVTWSATLGTVSSTGLYQAPTVGVNSTATVTATSAADPTKSASATVTVTAIPPTLSATFVPAQVGFSYSVPLVVSGGTAPFSYAVSSGQLPAGLALSASTGTVAGTPTTTGTFSFGITVTDSKSLSGTQTFQATVSPAVAVAVTPATATVQTPGTVLFTSTVANSTNQSVSWSTTLGTVSPTGVYQSPTVNANSTATVTATSAADPTKSASGTVTVTAIPLTLTGNFIPAQVGFTYNVPLTVGGGTAPYTYAISSGQLPAGVTLGTSSGTVSGNPTAAATSNFGVTVTDSKSVAGTATFQITVSPAVAVTVTPTAVAVASAATASLTALVSNTSNTSVTWSATMGTVSSTGLYQAPTVTADSTATVTATSAADPTKSAAASVTITPPPPPPLVIGTSTLSAATAGAAYSNPLSATGGKPPYSWSLASGTLPGGISAQSAGSLSGTATTAGQFSFTLEVADSSSPALTSSQPLTLTVNSSTGNGGAMPAALFGFSENNTSVSNFPTVTFGLQRFWDSPPLQWPSLNTASGVFDFTTLDTALATAYTNGVTLSMYTLARTPPWATSAPSDTSCNYATAASGGGNGECDAPNDLNSDGSGANAIWKAWITAIVTHVNDPTYLQTHAHIGYWEIWNEPDTQAFWGGSIAQLARLTEDANCLITGRGVIHESGNGTATPCTATAIDPTAKIVMAAAHAKGVALTYGQNELYCSANPTGYRLPCPNPPNAIAAAIDIVNFHMKPGNETGNTCPSPTLCTPESAMQMYISNVKGILQPAELAKPLWNGEASYSKSGFINAYTDTDMKASFMPRYFLINWSLGVSAMHWYTWESMTPTAVQTSYQQTYNWLYGSMLSMPCTVAGTVWSCTITKSGTSYLIMWDAAQSCSNGSCTTANQTVGSQWTQYQDMTTASTPIPISGNVVPVGIKPVVLQ